jgi:4-amino-4-deoxy-L-arabinose transferase-like glycosyltransferase
MAEDDRRTRHSILFSLVATSVALQVALLASNSQLETRLDENQYRNLAAGILDGRGLEGTLRPPVYPYFLALCEWLAPEATPWRVAIGAGQILSSVLSMLVMHRITALLYSEGAGLVAAGVFGLEPTLVGHSHMGWSDKFALLPMLSFLYALICMGRKPNVLRGVLSGFALGIGALTREYLLLFTAPAGTWLAVALGRRRAWWVLVVVAGAAIAIAPWTLRNARILDDFALISTNRWSPLFLANNDLPEWRSSERDGSRGGRMRRFYASFAGRDVEREAFARRHALRFIWDQQPLWAWSKLKEGLPALFSVDSCPLRYLRRGHYGDAATASERLVIAVSVASHLGLLVSIAFGMAATRWKREHALMLLFVLYSISVVMPFPVTVRYRLPTVTGAIPFAAHFLTSPAARAELLTDKRRLALAIGLASALVVLSLLDSGRVLARLL